jgi:uncharacterized protein
MHATITGLFTYPCKSMQGHSHKERTLTTEGLVGDREWMVVDRNGVFLTQRQTGTMAAIRASSQGTYGLVLEHDRHGAHHVLLDPANNQRMVRVWNDTVPAHDAGDATAQWLSDILKMDVRLARYADPHTRLSSIRWAGNTGAHTRFADGFSVLVTSDASLRALNAQMHRALPMDRFRPNVVIDGIDAWDEDHIDTLTCGAVTLKLVKPCVRCITTTTDQATGERAGEEPLNTLARTRNNPDLGGVTFGMNAIVVNGGTLTVGERFDVVMNF